MTTSTGASAPDFLQLLAHDLRWRLLQALARSDHRVQELVIFCGRPQNLVSYHLRRLRDAGLVSERRSSHDGRDVYYSLNLDELQSRYAASGRALHPGLTHQLHTNNGEPAGTARLAGTHPASDGDHSAPTRVLFLCNHNSARSQMAEGILRELGGDLVQVDSAGSEPTAVHPLAVRVMAEMNIDISSHRSKPMAQFAGQHFDYVITVCDRAREVCPVFPHDPERIHWSFPDPAAVSGPETVRYQTFQQTARELTTRINYLLLMIRRQEK